MTTLARKQRKQGPAAYMVIATTHDCDEDAVILGEPNVPFDIGGRVEGDRKVVLVERAATISVSYGRRGERAESAHPHNIRSTKRKHIDIVSSDSVDTERDPGGIHLRE
jgi:hypothetical protein